MPILNNVYMMEYFRSRIIYVSSMTMKKYSVYNPRSISSNQSCSIYNGVHENTAINTSNKGDCVARSRSEDHKCVIADFIDSLPL